MDKSKNVKNNFDKRTEDWLKTCIEGILFVSEGIVKAAEISATLGIKEKK